MSCGWVECVGIADRSAFDLAVHSAATKTEMVAREAYPEPKEVTVLVAKLNRAVLGKGFRTDAVAITNALDALAAAADSAPALAFQAKLDAEGSAPLTVGDKTHTITKDLVTFVS